MKNEITAEVHAEPHVKVVTSRGRKLRFAEIYFWVIAALLTMSPFIKFLIFYPYLGAQSVFIAEGGWLFTGFGVLLFPLVFRLIFEALPLESLGVGVQRGLQVSKRPSEPEFASVGAGAGNGSQNLKSTDSYAWLHSSSEEHERFLSCLASQSAATAKGIYARSGVYLLIGGGIAFSGIAFFYLQTTGLKSEEVTGATILSHAPRFGILFFIELIAFFFLRQYRAAMDEYRHYESLQRHREELLALTLLVQHQGKQLDAVALIKQGAFYSGVHILTKGETTELLETRKLEKDEVELLNKVVETVGNKKKN